MIRFILITFAVLAFAFWHLSGGSGFEPEQRAEAPKPVAEPAPQPSPQPTATPEPAPEPAPQPIVTPEPESQPEPAPQPVPRAAEPNPPVVTSPAPRPASPAVTPETPATEPVPAPADLRQVDATRVNMRSGPSTDYRVLDTLTQGTRVQVLEIDTAGAEPWAKLRVVNTGLEGWMAEIFLTRP